DEARSHLGDYAACLAADLAFHLAVAAATQNPFVTPFVEPIDTVLRDVYQEPSGYLATQESTLREHGPIADAIATRAADAARDAVAAPPHAQRAGWLDALAAALDDHAGELVPLADAESHLGDTRLTGELARTSAQLRLFGDVVREGSFLEAAIDHPDPSATPPIPDLRRMLIPLGPVAVFAASNFPFAFSVLGGDTASALAAGCPV